MLTVHRYAIEIMLESGHKPTRTVVLTFGFDEESGGVHVRLSAWLSCCALDKVA